MSEPTCLPAQWASAEHDTACSCLKLKVGNGLISHQSDDLTSCHSLGGVGAAFSQAVGPSGLWSTRLFDQRVHRPRGVALLDADATSRRPPTARHHRDECSLPRRSSGLRCVSRWCLQLIHHATETGSSFRLKGSGEGPSGTNLAGPQPGCQDEDRTSSPEVRDFCVGVASVISSTFGRRV